MLKKNFFWLTILFTIGFHTIVLGQNPFLNAAMTQAVDSVKTASPALSATSEINPAVNYSATPRKYIIADIDITGIEGTMYETQEFVLVGFSGLTKGQEIQIPGEDISNVIKRFWKQGLFSDTKIFQTKIKGDSVWLEIRLVDRPRVSDIRYKGIKKSEQEDIEKKISVVKGNQITPNQIKSAEIIIKNFFKDKGFGEATVSIIQRPDISAQNEIILDINIDKKEKIKVNKININGNESLSSRKLKWAMKKTNEKNNLLHLFRPKKFVDDLYAEDKRNFINKYHEYGYRDAEIIQDTVYKHNEKSVNINIKVNEGALYHIRSINWVGNTQYNSFDLNRVLNMKKGDIYNQKKLYERLLTDDDAVLNLYQNNGYLFSRIDPIEINIENDSVDLELRVVEGSKATIKNVTIQGNDRLYENVIRRELRTKPGAVYSKEDIIRSIREIAQTGHFDPENLQPDILPNPEDGTVSIGYPLTSKGNDQVEFSAGWGPTGLVGKMSLKLNNFSLKNMFNPSSYKGIIPQGDGQTLILSGQTNGKYYQSYQFSFIEPWFGGKRPNNFSLNAYYSRYTGLRSDLYNQSMYNNPYYYYTGGSMYNNQMYEQAMLNSMDPDQVFEMIGASIGYGKRLNWPDDYFYVQAELGYQRYNLRNWSRGWNNFPFTTGASNSVSLNLTFARNSTDNPIYTRAGSQFSLSLNITPPYSLLDNIDYAAMENSNPDKYKWNEYHKWKFKARTYTSITSRTITRTPVIATRIEFGFLGHYNRNKLTPFETFEMGGDGMSGYSTSFATEQVALRGYENNSIGVQARAYTRLGLELRYPIILQPNSTIYVLTFVEAGNAWQRINQFNPFDLKRSAGVGARIFLPMVGLMGVDWAYGFDPILGNRKNSGSKISFVLGQEF